MRDCPGPSFRPFCGKSTPNFPLVFSIGGNEWSLAPNSCGGGTCIGRMFMLVLDPSIKFDEVPAVLKYIFGVGSPPPDDEGRCAFLAERFQFSVVEPPDVERGYRPAPDDIGWAGSLPFRDCSPFAPVPSSRPDRFGSRFWRLKWLVTGRPVVREIFGRGNTRE